MAAFLLGLERSSSFNASSETLDQGPAPEALVEMEGSSIPHGRATEPALPASLSEAVAELTHPATTLVPEGDQTLPPPLPPAAAAAAGAPPKPPKRRHHASSASQATSEFTPSPARVRSVSSAGTSTSSSSRKRGFHVFSVVYLGASISLLQDGEGTPKAIENVTKQARGHQPAKVFLSVEGLKIISEQTLVPIVDLPLNCIASCVSSTDKSTLVFITTPQRSAHVSTGSSPSASPVSAPVTPKNERIFHVMQARHDGHSVTAIAAAAAQIFHTAYEQAKKAAVVRTPSQASSQSLSLAPNAAAPSSSRTPSNSSSNRNSMISSDSTSPSSNSLASMAPNEGSEPTAASAASVAPAEPSNITQNSLLGLPTLSRRRSRSAPFVPNPRDLLPDSPQRGQSPFQSPYRSRTSSSANMSSAAPGAISTPGSQPSAAAATAPAASGWRGFLSSRSTTGSGTSSRSGTAGNLLAPSLVGEDDPLQYVEGLRQHVSHLSDIDAYQVLTRELEFVTDSERQTNERELLQHEKTVSTLHERNETMMAVIESMHRERQRRREFAKRLNASSSGISDESKAKDAKASAAQSKPIAATASQPFFSTFTKTLTSSFNSFLSKRAASESEAQVTPESEGHLRTNASAPAVAELALPSADAGPVSPTASEPSRLSFFSRLGRPAVVPASTDATPPTSSSNLANSTSNTSISTSSSQAKTAEHPIPPPLKLLPVTDTTPAPGSPSARNHWRKAIFKSVLLAHLDKDYERVRSATHDADASSIDSRSLAGDQDPETVSLTPAFTAQDATDGQAESDQGGGVSAANLDASVAGEDGALESSDSVSDLPRLVGPSATAASEGPRGLATPKRRAERLLQWQRSSSVDLSESLMSAADRAVLEAARRDQALEEAWLQTLAELDGVNQPASDEGVAAAAAGGGGGGGGGGALSSSPTSTAAPATELDENADAAAVDSAQAASDEPPVSKPTPLPLFVMPPQVVEDTTNPHSHTHVFSSPFSAAATAVPAQPSPRSPVVPAMVLPLSPTATSIPVPANGDSPSDASPQIAYAHLHELMGKGIPKHLRGRVWLATARRGCALANFPVCTREQYLQLVDQETPHERQILVDIGRTFPSHPFFRDPEGNGQQALLNMMKAYSIHDPQLGYCQGLTFVAGCFLLNLNNEYDAFIVLLYVMRVLGVRVMYMPDMEALQLSLYQLSRLMYDFRPHLFNHLETREVKPFLYATSWFLTIFSSQFPLMFSYRVIDMLLLDGTLVMFRVTLQLMLEAEKKVLRMESFEEIVEHLKTAVPDLTLQQISETILRAVANRAVTQERLFAFESEYYIMKDALETQEGATAERNDWIKEKQQMDELVARLQHKNATLVLQNDNLEKEMQTVREAVILDYQRLLQTMKVEKYALEETVTKVCSEKADIEERLREIEGQLIAAKIALAQADAEKHELLRRVRHLSLSVASVSGEDSAVSSPSSDKTSFV
ncbi:lyncein, variant [Capsaspora owczarzaki ATCC 30864]|nr:lyncein, variant [Capsaspora owczarzaki ATCC 30864]